MQFLNHKILNITSFSEFDVDHLPRFNEEILPNDGVYNLAYAPNTSVVATNMMKFVESMVLVVFMGFEALVV